MFSAVNLLFPKRAVKNGVPVPSQNLAVGAAAVSPVGFPADVTGTSPVQFVEFSVNGADVSVRSDGTDPTAAIGLILVDGTTHIWAVSRFNAARFIEVSGAATIFAEPLTS